MRRITWRRLGLFGLTIANAMSANMAASVARPVVMKKGLIVSTATRVKGSVKEKASIPSKPHRTPA